MNAFKAVEVFNSKGSFPFGHHHGRLRTPSSKGDVIHINVGFIEAYAFVINRTFAKFTCPSATPHLEPAREACA